MEVIVIRDRNGCILRWMVLNAASGRSMVRKTAELSTAGTYVKFADSVEIRYEPFIGDR